MEDHSELIIFFLKKYDIPYWTEGKNVSPDTINIQCPFCGDDPSNHLCIFKESLNYSCWRCRRTGTFAFVLAYLTNQSVEILEKEIEDGGASFLEDSEYQIQELWGEESTQVSEEEKSDGPVELPPYFDLITPELKFPLLDHYLDLRGYTRETPIQYGCGVCTVGICMNRMVIPVRYKGELVSYQAADLTRRAQLKYKTARTDINDYLYRWDMIDWDKGYVILTEGVLDAWRIGDNALATFGTHLTDRQMNLLIRSKVKKVIMSWDADAYLYAVEQAEEINTFVPEVSIVQYPDDHDPDSYGRQYGVPALRELIFSS